MNKTVRILIVVALIAVVAGVLAIKNSEKSSQSNVEINKPSAVPQTTNEDANSSNKTTPTNIQNTVININVEQEKNTTTEIQTVETGNAKELKALPRLVDIGADKCIPCKMMAPILEELKKEYDGIFNVDFIDVWKNPDAGKEYNIKMIPTQIFFDSAGNELFRHEGPLFKEDILAKWKELNINIEKTQE